MRKFTALYLYLFIGFILGILSIASCTEAEEPDPKDQTGLEDPNDDSGPNSVLSKNEIQSKLMLLDATTVNGLIPPSSNLADLKVDKDTIFLVEGFKNRVRIAYPDYQFTGSSHFYLQVEGADEYLKIEPVKEESTDTLGVFYLGFDPEDMELPFSFKIKIAPIDDKGTPIDTIGTTVTVEQKGDLSCSPSLPDPYWNWIWTTIDGDRSSAPGHGRVTEAAVNGCCMEGYSVDCIANGIPESEWISLDYVSTYRIEYETLHFSSTLSGYLMEISQNIDPSESDFCNGAASYNYSFRDHIFWGDYSYNPANGQIQFSNLDSRKEEIYLEAIDYTVTEYDKYFIGQNYLYEIISCHFLMETVQVEGQSRIRLFERQKSENTTWHD